MRASFKQILRFFASVSECSCACLTLQEFGLVLLQEQVQQSSFLSKTVLWPLYYRDKETLTSTSIWTHINVRICGVGNLSSLQSSNILFFSMILGDISVKHLSLVQTFYSQWGLRQYVVSNIKKKHAIIFLFVSWIDQFKGEALAIFVNFRNPVFFTY